MMWAWSFAARTFDEVSQLLRALGRHRYVCEVDHRLHWTVDAALASMEPFASHARKFEERCRHEPDLEPGSRDPTLWRPAPIDELLAALAAFWTPGQACAAYRDRLLAAHEQARIEVPSHDPFECPSDDPPHPELLLLDWVLLAVDELDTERHKGALLAMEEAEEEVDASAQMYQEGPILAAPELCGGAPNGVLLADFTIWADGPYSYADYILRGAARSAKLVDPPVGYHDL
jgi:hypothetical protein